jgi:hypothetical protein
MQTPPEKSLRGLDALLAPQPVATPPVPGSGIVSLVTVPHPLMNCDDVEVAKEAIRAMLAEVPDPRRPVPHYTRAMLRNQHIVAYMLANPFATNTEICAFFGIGVSTLKTIQTSDAFRAMLQQVWRDDSGCDGE